MSNSDRERWDRRYAEGEYSTRTHASPLLEHWADVWGATFARGRALDVACGAGRNAVRLAALGFDVDGVDISAVALQRAAKTAEQAGVAVDWHPLDLDCEPLPHGEYRLILVSRFLDRKLLPSLLDALAEGGMLLYDQHLLTEAEVAGPQSRSFRLRPQELLHLAYPLRVLFYQERLINEADGRPMALAQLIACKGSAGY